jgi:hypothetical protein
MVTDRAALAFELWRLLEENDLLRARTKQLEEDIQELIDSSDSTEHSNTKKKIQYHVR